MTGTWWKAMNKQKFPFILLLFTAAVPLSGADIDYSAYEEILEEYTRDGFVDYAALKNSTAAQELTAFLDEAGTIRFDSLEPEEIQALLVNLYNGYTISLVTENYPVESIRDIPDPWSTAFCTVNGKRYTLDEVEKELLIGNYPDARFHFVVNCSAVSCPPLPSRPLRAETLERDLETAASGFINDPRFNQYFIEKQRRGLRREDVLVAQISEIFRWYEKDFQRSYGSIEEMLILYIADPEAQRLIREGKVEIEYLPYDWRLNDLS